MWRLNNSDTALITFRGISQHIKTLICIAFTSYSTMYHFLGINAVYIGLGIDITYYKYIISLPEMFEDQRRCVITNLQVNMLYKYCGTNYGIGT